MNGGRRVTDDAIRAALAVSPRAEPRPDLDSAIARAIRAARQDQPPIALRLGLSPRLPLPGLGSQPAFHRASAEAWVCL